MKYNGIYLNLGICVGKDGNDYFTSASEFYRIADELNDEELECLVYCVEDLLNIVGSYQENRRNVSLKESLNYRFYDAKYIPEGDQND